MDIQKEREAFEAWCHVDDKFCTHRYAGSEDYSDDYAQCAWLAWQAAKASVAEGSVLMPKEPTKDTLIEIASVCIGDDFANLDEAKELYKAVIKAQEQNQ